MVMTLRVACVLAVCKGVHVMQTLAVVMAGMHSSRLLDDALVQAQHEPEYQPSALNPSLRLKSLIKRKRKALGSWETLKYNRCFHQPRVDNCQHAFSVLIWKHLHKEAHHLERQIDTKRPK